MPCCSLVDINNEMVKQATSKKLLTVVCFTFL